MNIQHYAFCVLVYDHERGYEDELEGCLLFISKTQAETYINTCNKKTCAGLKNLPPHYTKYEKIEYIPVHDQLFYEISKEIGPIWISDIKEANKADVKYELGCSCPQISSIH